MISWVEEPDLSVGFFDSEADSEDTALQRFFAQHPELREHVTGPAWRSIKCEPRYLHLFRTVLRGVLIVKDLSTAQTLLTLLANTSGTDAFPHVERLVTLH